MIHLHMVRDDIIDILRVNDLSDMAQHLREEEGLHSIYEGDLFINDEIGVIGSASVGGIPVKTPDVPVDGTNPIDAFS